MKQIKNFILMSVLLLMGSVCWAQETTKKDSIWGLEVKSNDNSFHMSYYWDFSNNGVEEVFAFVVKFYYNDVVKTTYIQYEKEELWGKMFENCKIDTISENVWKITIYDLKPVFSGCDFHDIKKVGVEGYYHTDVNAISFSIPNFTSLKDVNNFNEREWHVYISPNGIMQNKSRNQLLIDQCYVGDKLVSVQKIISSNY